MVLFVPKRRGLPPTAMVAYVLSACDGQDRRWYEPISSPRSYGPMTSSGYLSTRGVVGCGCLRD